jgi:uncharacterized protein (TIGR03435 family)
MRAAATLILVLAGAAFAQQFEVASVKPSAARRGPDYNNRLTFEPAGFTARNATIKRLVAEAYRVQFTQVAGPNWIDENEYDIDAKAGGAATQDQIALMLRALLADRFKLAEHRETREMRAYELVVDKGGPKIHAFKEGDAPSTGPGFRFHGELRDFADFLAVQLSVAMPDDPTRPGIASNHAVPVLDKTGLAGIYDFSADIRLEPGADIFNLWQDVLRERLGLRLDAHRGPVDALVVDSAEKIPTSN